jgi:hypothetical protein
MNRFVSYVMMGLSVNILWMWCAPALAENYDEVFASRINYSQDWIQNWNVRFVPKGNYNYRLEIAGRTLENLACETKTLGQTTSLEWKKVKAELGTNQSTLYAEGEFLPIFGTTTNRTRVARGQHFRVAVINDRGDVVHRTPWSPRDVRGWGDWNNVSCGWVKD